MGGEGQGQNDFATAFNFALPLATGVAGFLRPEAAQGFTGMANIVGMQSLMDQRMQEEARKKREESRELEQSGAIAEQMAKLGLVTDPRLSPATQVSFGNTQIAMQKAKKEADDALNAQRAMGGLQGVRAQVGSELPDVLQQTLLSMAPQSGLTPQTSEVFGKAKDEIAESGKRLAEARAFGRPFEEAETLTVNAPQEPSYGTLDDPSMKQPPTFGVTLPERSITETRLPPGVQDVQRQIMLTGQVPKARDAFAQYNLPLSKLPGGAEALQAATKPAYAPSVADVTDAQGNVTTRVVRVDPATGQPIVETFDRGRIGQPQQPASRNQAQLLGSLGARMQGLTEPSHGVLPEHKDLTPEQAANVAERIERASAELTPHTQFLALREEIAYLAEDVNKARRRAGDQQLRPAERAAAQEDFEAKSAEMGALRRALRRFMEPQRGGQQSPPKAPPPPVPGGGRSEAEAVGVVAPRR